MDDAVAAVEGGHLRGAQRQASQLDAPPRRREGWKELATLLAETLEGVMDIQAKSAGRLGEMGEKGTPAAVTMIGYEAFPEGLKKRAR